MTSILQHTLARPKGLVECDVVLDVGAGIRPMRWYRPKRHICVDPYVPYCDVLKAAGYETIRATAEQLLEQSSLLQTADLVQVDAVYLLDVIEHMEKDEGERVLRLACETAQQQVVVFTPYGFDEQTSDVWGMDGDYWQTHRSGWFPEEFSASLGWRVQIPRKGFFAIWDRHSTHN